MSNSYIYQSASATAAHHDDHDSDPDLDLDLDLEELDPQTTSSFDHATGTRNGQVGNQEFGARIPLKNLRLGGRRGYRRALTTRDGDNDDLEALVGGDNDSSKRESATGSGVSDDDAPLLRPSHGLRRLSQQSHSVLSKLRARFTPFAATPAALDDTHSEPDEEHDPSTNRIVQVGRRQTTRFPPNAVSNAKYTPVSFLPRTLYNEFSFFFNMYFLLVALSQVIPALRIGYLSTYVVPLAFVLAITLGKEALDDVGRRRRDNEANSERYPVLDFQEPGSAQSAHVNLAEGRKKAFRKPGKIRRASIPLESTDAIDQGSGYRPSTAPEVIFKEILKPSRDLRVGDVLVMHKDRRFPADVVILKSFSADSSLTGSEPESLDMGQLPNPAVAEVLIDTDAGISTTERGPLINHTTSQDPSAGGEAFIRTDQLDGETDWKLRLASALAQDLSTGHFTRLRVTANKPDKKVNEFVGTLALLPPSDDKYDPYVGKSANLPNGEPGSAQSPKSIPLSIDNTAWANTVLASSSTVLAVVIYTGPQTRAALSTSASRSKNGLLENEINSLTKILCFLTLALSVILVALEGFESRDERKWYVAVMRFLILFSTIVPISLRVNLDMGKSVYAWFIERDTGIPDTVVRTSTIPEDLGRIEYLLSDKTGTLTQNGRQACATHDDHKTDGLVQRWSSKRFTSGPCPMPTKPWTKCRRTLGRHFLRQARLH